MRNFTGSELLWLFLIYSFAGWVLETVFATVRQRGFANRGLINGPLCISYGVAAVLITVGLKDLSGFWLFFFIMVYTAVVEWIGGHLIEKVFKERWWDYSDVKWNLDGYICLPFILLWGVLGYIIARWGNGFILKILWIFPSFLTNILLIVLLGILFVDIFASYLLLTQKGKKLDKWEEANNSIANVSAGMEHWIMKYVDQRIQKAYPKARQIKIEFTDTTTVFAQGCGFYKLVLLFVVGAFLGDITETIFCRLKMGVWMSRSSVVWGPFSIVWGLAIAMATALLYKYKDKSNSFLFLIGTLLGGAYEYFCSVFTEIVFGKVFWDYSAIPFNLGGRINLLYCFFWGFAAVIWFKVLYPKVSALIEKIPVMFGKILTWALLLFMCCNALVSAVALVRYDQRDKGVKAEKVWQSWCDTHYDDQKMELIYPKAKKAG